VVGAPAIASLSPEMKPKYYQKKKKKKKKRIKQERLLEN
jgi:hypothetical protein